MSMDYEKLAVNIADAMKVSPKPNPGIEKARKRFGSFVDALLSRESFRLDDFSGSEKRIIRKLQDFRYGPLVYESGGVFRVKKTIGKVVRIVYNETDPRCRRIADLIQDVGWKRGCHVTSKYYSDTESKRYMQLVPEPALAELPQFALSQARYADIRIFIGDDDDPFWANGFEQKLRLSAPASQKLRDVMDRAKVYWGLVGFPVKRDPKTYVVDPKRFEDIYLKSLDETYSRATLENCMFYEAALRGGDEVRITADDGTDLSFSIKGRPVLVADGIIDDEDEKRGDIGLNIPDGEVFLAPLENSANGRIRFDYVTIHGYGLVKDFWVTFRKGRAVKFEADKEGEALFKRFMDANTGEKDRIAELGIGTNKAAEFIGTTVVDEKIFGSVHIAIGNNTGAYHGKNKASSHQDMIKIMKGRSGNMYVDRKLVMKDGMPHKG